MLINKFIGKLATIMATKVNKEESKNYGCFVYNDKTLEVQHYMEKPDLYLSDVINCGVYLFSKDIFN